MIVNQYQRKVSSKRQRKIQERTLTNKNYLQFKKKNKFKRISMLNHMMTKIHKSKRL